MFRIRSFGVNPFEHDRQLLINTRLNALFAGLCRCSFDKVDAALTRLIVIHTVNVSVCEMLYTYELNVTPTGSYAT